MDGSETATLPAWWKEGVLVIDDQSVATWVGRRVKPWKSGTIGTQRQEFPIFLTMELPKLRPSGYWRMRARTRRAPMIHGKLSDRRRTADIYG